MKSFFQYGQFKALSFHGRVLFLLALLLMAALHLKADTISSNLTNVTAGTESASGTTWLAASFGAGSSASSLSSVTLLLSNSLVGAAEVDVYSNSLLQPSSLLGTLVSPSSYSSTLAYSRFTSSGLTLQANTTYWIVLKAISGEFQWAWTSNNSGTGTGYQGTWGSSTDAGSNWFTYDVYPTQLSVETTAGSAVPEPYTVWLVVGGLLVGALTHGKRQQA